MLLSIIVAIDQNFGIGKDNQLMWHLPNDLKFFKNKTMGHHMIMEEKRMNLLANHYQGEPL